MSKQRITKNLGLNRSKDRVKILQYIENVLGIKEKKCGMTNLTKYGFKHSGQNPLPIRNFNLRDVNIVNGKVIIGPTTKDGLQPNCMFCEGKYRAGRLHKWHKIYDALSPNEICDSYRKNYQELDGLKFCKRCNQYKKPEEFRISRGMETGLHNSCKSCSDSYAESVGHRWIIYSPDGHEAIDIGEEDCCKICKIKKDLHKDHIFPIAKGGTDNRQNIQILCGHHNLSKSDNVISPAIDSIADINEKMICERYRDILDKAKKENWDLSQFESEITRAVRKFILWKKHLSDANLALFFEKEKVRNNRKHGVEHAVKKFRKYCNTAILEPNKYLEE